MENKVNALAEQGRPPAEIAAFVLNTLSDVVCRTTRKAMQAHPGLPVLCSGGVASNRLLRREMEARCGALFAQPRYSTDNAMGAAILARRLWEREERA